MPLLLGGLLALAFCSAAQAQPGPIDRYRSEWKVTVLEKGSDLFVMDSAYEQSLRDRYAKMNLTKEQVEKNIEQHRKEGEDKKADRIFSGTLRVVRIGPTILSTRLWETLQKGTEEKPHTSKVADYYDGKIEAMFDGGDSYDKPFAHGSVSLVDPDHVSSEQGPPSAWLPHTVGHALARWLVGAMPLEELLPWKDGPDGSRVAEMKNYIYRATNFHEGDTSRPGRIDWHIGSLEDRSGLSVFVDAWRDVSGHLVPSEFRIEMYGGDGVVAARRHFKMTTAAVNGDVSEADAKQIIPSGVAVIDSRVDPPQTYVLNGEFPPVGKLQEQADQEGLGAAGPAKKTSFFAGPGVVGAGAMIFGVVGVILYRGAKGRQKAKT